MANWTREQTIIALGVYCKIPFNKASNTNPEIVEAAKLIGRSPAAVKMKVGNFGSFDPELRKRGIVGLSNASKIDEDVWNEYCDDWERLAYDCKIIKAKLEHKSIIEEVGADLSVLSDETERDKVVRQRINQSFFRSVVLSSYNNRCCITGLSCVELLEACHIVDWSSDKKNRLNPSNGICLNLLFHRAYDKHYIGISPDYIIHISERLLDNGGDNTDLVKLFKKYHKTTILLPDRFLPDRELLSLHYEDFKRM